MHFFKMALSFSALIFMCGCIILPIPYKGVPYGNISGQLIDDVTQKPVSNAEIYIQSHDDSKTTSDQEGSFFIPATKRWRFDYHIWLIPPNPDRYTLKNLHIKAYSYRNQAFQIYSLPIRLPDSSRQNLEMLDDLGIIRLKPLQEPRLYQSRMP